MATRPAIAASLVCKNVDKAYEYFTEVLGFAGEGKWNGPDGNTMHASVVLPTRFGQGNVMLGPMAAVVNDAWGDSGEFGENVRNSPETLGNGVVLFFNVPDVDKYHAFIKGRGAIVDEPPTDQAWGDRTISVLTPDNYYLTFATPIKGFQAPPGMGDKDNLDPVQASAPGTKKLRIPGLKATRKTKATATKARRKR